MIKKSWFCSVLALIATLCCSGTIKAQEAANPTANDTEKAQEKKAEREKNALVLLEQIVNDSQLLRLPENRVNVQIDMADLLWDSNQARARTLFTGAADGVAELMRSADPNEERRGPNSTRTASQLRQKLVLTAAAHEAALAYQLLATTQPVSSPVFENRMSRGSNGEDLEQMLLARIATLDPQLALQNTMELLEKGQFPRSITGVLTQLQRKDPEGAAKLEEKVVKRLQATNLLSVQDASSLALSLLRSGPRPATDIAGDAKEAPNAQGQFLAPATYVDVLGTVIDNGMKSTPQPRNTRNQVNPRGRRSLGAGAAAGPGAAGSLTDAQIEQLNARRLMWELRSLLPRIEEFLPARVSAVNEKLAELGMVENSPAATFNLMRQGSAEALLAAARSAPQQMQTRVYQRAATRALEEGNSDLAKQIANDHLQGSASDRILKQIEFRQIADKADATRLDDLRATLYKLGSDEERIDLLVRLSSESRKDNPKLALQLLDQAKQMTSKRAVSYQQFEQQLKVAEAFRDLEPSRSFEVLEPGITQLNELLSAASVLSGFEVNVFRDGELPLESRNGLNGMIIRYGQALGALAKLDFARAQSLAERFQLTEPRILARISIVRGLLR